MEFWQRSSCGPQMLGHPAADGRVEGCTEIPRRQLDFAKIGNFRKIIKLMNSLSMYNTSDELFFSIQNVAILARKRNMKQCFQRWRK